jgi:hypothetical protein
MTLSRARISTACETAHQTMTVAAIAESLHAAGSGDRRLMGPYGAVLVASDLRGRASSRS